MSRYVNFSAQQMRSSAGGGEGGQHGGVAPTSRRETASAAPISHNAVPAGRQKPRTGLGRVGMNNLGGGFSRQARTAMVPEHGGASSQQQSSD